MTSCPICTSEDSTIWDEDKFRSYYLCKNCELIFVPRKFILSPELEHQRYLTHENNADDPRYQNYLGTIKDSILPFISKEGRGLDFGCGESTLLSKLFGEINVDNYDLYFHPDESFWQKQYDFIILSEVIEHLANPIETMKKLRSRLLPEGQFFIKTRYYPKEQKEFGNWFYKKDPTHIQFFNPESMAFLARMLEMNRPENLECRDLVRMKTKE